MNLKKTSKLMMKNLINGIIKSLKDNPEDWKAGSLYYVGFYLSHKEKKIRIGYRPGLESGHFEIQYAGDDVKGITFWTRLRLKREVRKRYLKYNEEQKLLKIQEMVEGLK